MKFESVFTPLAVAEVHEDATARRDGGWRYVQILAVNKDAGVDLVYSYMKDGHLENLVVADVPREAHVPSISDLYLEAFVCENEIHDLFGVAFDDIAIDFLGNFYRVSSEYPMTIISPEQLAEREKQKKIAAAKAAKAAKEKTAHEGGAGAEEADTAAGDGAERAPRADKDAELEAKLAAMDPEKAAKVRAAMKAKAAKEGN